MRIRPETPDDADAIHDLTARAFAPVPFSDDTEPAIIRGLRRDGDLILSLVAEDADTHALIGHVAFSPLRIDGHAGGWVGLGPISVEIDRQRQGIGAALVAEGLARIRATGAPGCALTGNPDIYRGMGFESDGALTYQGIETRYIQRIVFTGPAPRGELTFAPAFDATPGA